MRASRASGVRRQKIAGRPSAFHLQLNAASACPGTREALDEPRVGSERRSRVLSEAQSDANERRTGFGEQQIKPTSSTAVRWEHLQDFLSTFFGHDGVRPSTQGQSGL